MSIDRSAIARSLVELWNSPERDVEKAARYCDAAVELSSPLSQLAGEPYVGLAGLRSWLSDVEEQFSEWRVDLEQTRESGDAVLTLATIRARGRTSGIELEFATGIVMNFSDEDLITGVRIYTDVGQAIEAVDGG